MSQLSGRTKEDDDKRVFAILQTSKESFWTTIWDASGTLVLIVLSDTLDKGEHQAHDR